MATMTQPTLHDDLAYSASPYLHPITASTSDWHHADAAPPLNLSFLENCTSPWTTAGCSPLPPTSSTLGTRSPASYATTIGGDDYYAGEEVRDPGRPLAETLETVASFRAAMALVVWLFPLVVGVGVVGNAVSLWVLLRRGMRRTSACRYLAFLAVADTAVLLASALKTWVRVVWGFELLHVSQASCKLLIFLTHLSLMTAAWLIVAVTLERFLAVWLPLRAPEVCSVGRTRVVITALLALLALVNAHVFWTAELVPLPARRSGGSAGVVCSSYAYRTLACRVFPWVHLALYCFLPAALLLSLNGLILYRLYQRRQALLASSPDSSSSRSSSNRHNNNNNNGAVAGPPAGGGGGGGGPAYGGNACYTQLPKNKSQTKLLLQQHQQGSRQSPRAAQRFHRRLAPMLLGVSFCWLLLATPQTLYSLAAPAPQTLQEAGRQYLVKTLCFLLLYLNHALNFFLYCLTGQRFRQELRRGLPCSDSERSARVRKAFLPRRWAGPADHRHGGRAKSRGHDRQNHGGGEGEEEELAGGRGAAGADEVFDGLVVGLNGDWHCDRHKSHVHCSLVGYPLVEFKDTQKSTCGKDSTPDASS